MTRKLLWIVLFAVCLFQGLQAANAQPQCGSWVAIHSPTSPPPRLRSALAFDYGLHKSVLFGGTGVTSGMLVVLGDTWLWNSASKNWEGPLLLGAAPSARYGSAMAYDSHRNVVVLFGGAGADNLALADTWEFNGTTWTQMTPPDSPAPRSFHALVYDAALQQVVLFGGMEGSNLAQDTWSWNGTQWTPLDNSGPAAREMHSLAYDEHRNKTVLFGGYQGSSFLSDLWEFDGTNWTASSALGPAPRVEGSMTYEPKLLKSVLFGGLTGASVALGDTWTWDGTAWVQLQISGPAARRGAVSTYDDDLSGIVLFGGTDDQGTVFGDTWLYAVPDTDNDGVPDCMEDLCPTDPLKTTPGVCGCGVPDTDSDLDGTPDCVDLCPHDPAKTAPGICGCGVPDRDLNGDFVIDCASAQALSAAVSPKFGALIVSGKSLRLVLQKFGTAKSSYAITLKGPGAKGKSTTYTKTSNLTAISKLKSGAYTVRFRVTQTVKVGKKSKKVTSQYSVTRSFAVI